MPCNITLDRVIGINPNSDGIIQAAEAKGTADCRKVKVLFLGGNLTTEVEVGSDGSYSALFDLVSRGFQVRCGTRVKARAYCVDNPSCDTGDLTPKVECPTLTRPRYVSYYDCTGWNSKVEVMNLQDHDANFTITLYRRNGSLVWQDTIKAMAHETKQIPLDKYAPRSEGLAVIEPEKEGDEFPAMLCITNATVPPGLGQVTTAQLQRFVPFIRVS